MYNTFYFINFTCTIKKAINRLYIVNKHVILFMIDKKVLFYITLLLIIGCGSGGDGIDNSGLDGDGISIDPVGVNDALKPETLPLFTSLNLYNASSPFNKQIDFGADIDPNSEALIQNLLTATNGKDEFVLQLKQYSTTVFIADNSTTKFDVKLACGSTWEMGVNFLTQVPIPDFAEPSFDSDGSDNPIKVGKCGEDSDQDNNMVIIDLENRCEYDFWQMRKENGAWVASWANGISLDSNGIYEKGLSTRGSGFAFLGGVIWPDELKNGEIKHALVFNYPFTKSGGPVAPATDSDGVTNNQNTIPEGALLRLDSSLNLENLDLTGVAKTMAKALQKYGMYLVDTGGDSGIGFYVIDPKSTKTNPYLSVLPNEDFPIIKNIPINKLQVMKLPPQDANYQDKLDLVTNACAQFN
jgi:hypothetical protein